MRRSILKVLFAAAAVSSLAGCQPNETPKPLPGPNSSPSPTASGSPNPSVSPGTSPSVDPKAPAAIAAKIAALEGSWPGPDGAQLKVTKAGDKYLVEITGADKKTESFDGAAKGNTIEFTRKGKLETIKASTPEETGMKWPQGEMTCVVINKGTESYCRK